MERYLNLTPTGYTTYLPSGDKYMDNSGHKGSKPFKDQEIRGGGDFKREWGHKTPKAHKAQKT